MEAERQRRTGAPTGGEANTYALARSVSASDPAGRAVEAFDQVVSNLGWAQDTDKIVFAHTHQPLEDVTAPGSTVRYWNTGSWIYEPDLSSREAYLAYLRNGWPGTVVLIDSDAASAAPAAAARAPQSAALHEHRRPRAPTDAHTSIRRPLSRFRLTAHTRAARSACAWRAALYFDVVVGAGSAPHRFRSRGHCWLNRRTSPGRPASCSRRCRRPRRRRPACRPC